MKAGIERILKERVPEITSVHNLGEVISDEGTAVTL
jgi:Fe-S cluster biogenesis protein NfuA